MPDLDLEHRSWSLSVRLDGTTPHVTLTLRHRDPDGHVHMWPAAYPTADQARRAGNRWLTGRHPNPCCPMCEKAGR